MDKTKNISSDKLFDVLFVLLALLLPLFFVLPILTSGQNLGIQDWDQHLAYFEASRKTVLEYGQFPLWNPYHCGGMPNFANPQTSIISLNFLLVLVFGTLLGIKLGIYLHYVIGFVGFYLFARSLQIDRLPSLLGSVIFSFSGVLSSAIGAGMPPFLSLAYTPYVFLFLDKAIGNKIKKGRYIALSAIFLALSFYNGYQITLWLLPILAVYILFFSLQHKNPDGLFIFLKSLAIFLLICLPKLYLSLTLGFDRPTNYSGYKLQSLLYFLVSRRQNYHNQLSLPADQYFFGLDENSLYIGFFPLLFLVVGLLLTFRKNIHFFFTLVVNLWLMLGDNLKISLWFILRKLPFYEYAQVAQRFRFSFIFILAIFSAIGLQKISALVPTRLRNICGSIIVLVIYLDLLTFSSSNFLSKSFIIENPLSADKRSDITDFKNVNGLDISYSYSAKSDLADELKGLGSYLPLSIEFLTVRQNLGMIDCYEPIHVDKAGVIASEDDERYKGEAYLINQKGQAKIKYWSPGRVEVEVWAVEDEDILVLNQNYDDHWFVGINGEKEKAENYNGLVAVMIDSAADEVFFYYRYLTP